MNYFALFLLLFAVLPISANEVKKIDKMTVLSVEQQKDHSNIASVFADLVDYYNNGDLNEIKAMKIVFPQISFIDNGKTFIAIAFEGKAKETDKVKIKIMPKGISYSVDYIGPYQKLDKAINDAFESLIIEGRFPNKNKPLRLLYWNSPDDNPPHKLHTEIQIPLL